MTLCNAIYDLFKGRITFRDALQCYLRPIQGKDHFSWHFAMLFTTHSREGSLFSCNVSSFTRWWFKYHYITLITTDVIWRKTSEIIDEDYDKYTISPKDAKNDILVYLVEDNVVGDNVDHEIAASTPTMLSVEVHRGSLESGNPPSFGYAMRWNFLF